MTKILYIGAGRDTDFIDTFIKCKEFILIDTLPRSEWDDLDFFNYRHNFIDELKQNFNNKGFELNKIIELNKRITNKECPFINSHLLEFVKDKTIIKYYASTNINSDMCPMLEKDLVDADTLYVKGYFPDIKLFEYFEQSSNKKIFVGDEDTVYKDNDNIDINIINYMQNKKNANRYFSSYYINIINMLFKCDKKQFHL